MTILAAHIDCVWAGILADLYERHDAIYTTTPPGGDHGRRQGAEPRLDRGATTGCSQPDRPVPRRSGTPADTAPPQARGGQASELHDPRSSDACKDFARAEGEVGASVAAGAPTASHRLVLGEGRTLRLDVTAWTAGADKAPAGTGKGPAGAGEKP